MEINIVLFRVYGLVSIFGYIMKKDFLFCYICSNQYFKGNLVFVKNIEQVFIFNGYSNWKKVFLKFKDY